MLLAAYRLAFHFHRPLSELNITMREFFAWMAYLHIEPPERGDNERTAALMAQITNMSGKSLPKGKQVSPADFLGGKKRQTLDQQKAFFKSIGKQNGG